MFKKIEVTFSKIMALVLLMAVTFLVYTTKDTSVFTFSLPFIIVLITGKQAFDSYKHKITNAKDWYERDCQKVGWIESKGKSI